MARTGRPKKGEDRKSNGTFVRLRDTEETMVEEMMKEIGINKSEVIRRSIQVFYYSSRK